MANKKDLKAVLTNKHEREFYNFCVGGRYRTIEHNVEFARGMFNKIKSTRAIEIAEMADRDRDNNTCNGNLFAYCYLR